LSLIKIDFKKNTRNETKPVNYNLRSSQGEFLPTEWYEGILTAKAFYILGREKKVNGKGSCYIGALGMLNLFIIVHLYLILVLNLMVGK
jgi:hypothetical protein